LKSAKDNPSIVSTEKLLSADATQNKQPTSSKTTTPIVQSQTVISKHSVVLNPEPIAFSSEELEKNLKDVRKKAKEDELWEKIYERED